MSAPPPAPTPTPTPATPQVRVTPTEGLPASFRPGRRSFAPGSNFEYSPAMGRKSCMPRMSTMPSAPNKLTVAGAAAVALVSQSEYQAVKAEANRLKLQLEAASEKLEEERRIRQKKEDENISLFKKTGELETRLARFQKEVGRTERRAKREEEEKVKGENEINEIRKELSETIRKNEEAEGNLTALRATLSDVQEEAENHAKSLNQKIENLTLELDEKVEQIEKLSDDLERAQSQYDALAESKQETLTKMDDLTVELERLQEDTKQAKETHQDVVAELKNAQKRVAEMTHKIDSLECDIIEKDTALNFKAEQIAKEKKENQTLVEKHRKDMTNAKNQVVDAQTSLKIKEDECRELEMSKQELESQVEDLTEENEKLKAANQTMRTEDAKSIKEVQNSAATLQQTNEELKDQVKDYKRKVQKLEKEVKALKTEVEELGTRNDELATENETLEESNADLDYKLRCEEHNAKKQTLIAEKLRGKVEQKDADIKELKKSKKALVAQANERIDSMNEETKKLETIANNYRTEYELLKSRLQRQARRRNFSMIQDDDEEDKESGCEPLAKKRRSLPVRRSVTFGTVDEDDISMDNKDEKEDAQSELFCTPAPEKKKTDGDNTAEKKTEEEEKDGAGDDEQDLEKQDFKTLKSKCKTLGLKLNGSKADLIERLREHNGSA
eukprot:TRINITY_DN14541_c0_g1_i1.p1 TRINITY_DN14541_c0_g1~~TRINITY_DN14541_c0_g1_i1.p1  ORF type:complete len:689 (+),score=378.03 TRINITY_DN14541_c0_g1_i1:46-2067(+)